MTDYSLLTTDTLIILARALIAADRQLPLDLIAHLNERGVEIDLLT